MPDNDDLLNPEDIDSLLDAGGEPSGGGTGAADSAPSANASSADAASTGSSPSDAARGASPSAAQPPPSAASSGHQPPSASPRSQPDVRTPATAEQLLNQAEADLQAALSPHLDASGPTDQATPYQFPEFDRAEQEDDGQIDVDAIRDVELDVCIELGRTELLIEEVLKLREGSIVPLDKLAGDPVDIVVNGRLVARGEVLVLNDNFCVRVAEILPPDV